MMFRVELNSLASWASRPTRKPLVVRGARQVGKTYLIREFSKLQNLRLIEYNFDRNPEKKTLFSSNPKDSLINIQADSGQKVSPGECLLFLDEIQAAPEIFSTLRYWYEELPQLHIIAAGSLLDIVLNEHQFSMPVGRIEYLFMGPMSFDEFLIANDQSELQEYLCQHENGKVIPDALHMNAMRTFNYYLAVGGMPAAVKEWVDTKNIENVQRQQQSILLSYQDDFAKYGEKINVGLLRKVFQSFPLNVGRKIKYSHLSPDSKAIDVRKSLDLLSLARVIQLVHHSGANGTPLAAEVNSRDFKGIFVDIGLLNSMMNVNWSEILPSERPELIHQGLLCEQFVGQHLLYIQKDYRTPELYYWNREKRNSSAEVDYLVQAGSKVVPVEVKAGKTGRLKSLKLFVEEKKCPFALRLNSDQPSIVDFNGVPLYSLPFYMIGQIHRLYFNAESTSSV